LPSGSSPGASRCGTGILSSYGPRSCPLFRATFHATGGDARRQSWGSEASAARWHGPSASRFILGRRPRLGSVASTPVGAALCGASFSTSDPECSLRGAPDKPAPLLSAPTAPANGGGWWIGWRRFCCFAPVRCIYPMARAHRTASSTIWRSISRSEAGCSTLARELRSPGWRIRPEQRGRIGCSRRWTPRSVLTDRMFPCSVASPTRSPGTRSGCTWSGYWPSCSRCQRSSNSPSVRG
jgi:hypothetical protein